MALRSKCVRTYTTATWIAFSNFDSDGYPTRSTLRKNSYAKELRNMNLKWVVSSVSVNKNSFIVSEPCSFLSKYRDSLGSSRRRGDIRSKMIRSMYMSYIKRRISVSWSWARSRGTVISLLSISSGNYMFFIIASTVSGLFIMNSLNSGNSPFKFSGVDVKLAITKFW